MLYAETQGPCEALQEKIIHRYLRFAPKAVEQLEDDWERLVTFYQFSREYWPHSRTNNVAELPSQRSGWAPPTAKRFKKV
jgi:transposase-like protein